jgi:hypothetical protein
MLSWLERDNPYDGLKAADVPVSLQFRMRRYVNCAPLRRPPLRRPSLLAFPRPPDPPAHRATRRARAELARGLTRPSAAFSTRGIGPRYRAPFPSARPPAVRLLPTNCLGNTTLPEPPHREAMVKSTRIATYVLVICSMARTALAEDAGVIAAGDGGSDGATTEARDASGSPPENREATLGLFGCAHVVPPSTGRGEGFSSPTTLGLSGMIGFLGILRGARRRTRARQAALRAAGGASLMRATYSKRSK